LFVGYRDDDVVLMSNVGARKIKHVDIHRALSPKTGLGFKRLESSRNYSSKWVQKNS